MKTIDRFLHECKHSTSVVASIKYPLHMLQVMCALTNFNGILLDFCWGGGDDTGNDARSPFISSGSLIVLTADEIDFISFCFTLTLIPLVLSIGFEDCIGGCCGCCWPFCGSVVILLRAICIKSDVTGAIVEISNKRQEKIQEHVYCEYKQLTISNIEGPKTKRIQE